MLVLLMTVSDSVFLPSTIKGHGFVAELLSAATNG